MFRVRKSARNDTNTAVNTTESRVTVREGKTFLFDINDEIGDLLNTSDDYEDNYDYTNEVSKIIFITLQNIFWIKQSNFYV